MMPIKPLVERMLRRFGYAPVAKRTNFTAAAIGRLTQDFSTSLMSADSGIRRGLKVMRARARDIHTNSPYGSKMLHMLRSNVLGCEGMSLTMRIKDPDMLKGQQVQPGKPDRFANKLIGEHFWKWGRKETCTMSGQLSWLEVQQLALNSLCVDGEFLFRKINDPTNPYKFALHPIEPDMLDLEYNEERRPNGHSIRMGVEVNAYGKPVAYHIWRWNPDDNYMRGADRQNRDRVDASEIIHGFISHRIGQTRGYPWSAPVMLALRMLDGYTEAEITKARLAASKMAFFTRSGEVGYTGEDSGEGKYMDAEPGLMEELPQGLDIKTVDWNSPNANYSDFHNAILRTIASGLGIDYNTFAGDLTNVNFSSSRVGLQEVRSTYKVLQKWFADHLCQPVFEGWLESALTSGQLGTLPLTKFNKFNSTHWAGRQWEWVDPTKEVTAKIAELNSGLTSLTRIYAERNIDRDELFDEIAEDKQAMEERGITLPTLYGVMEQMQMEQAAEQQEQEQEAEEPETSKEPKRRSDTVEIVDRKVIELKPRPTKKQVEFRRNSLGEIVSAEVVEQEN